MPACPPQPTATEIKVIALFAQGLTREEVGRKLFISPLTVRDHLKNLREKLSEGLPEGQRVTNVTHCVSLCIVLGHLQIDSDHGRVTALELELAHAA